MRFYLTAASLMICFSALSQHFTVSADSTKLTLTTEGASHLAGLPLKCLQQEYPNKTGHTSINDADHLRTPQQLHPAFYGCFDWHSSVHGHWMLVKLLKEFPSLPQADSIRLILSQNLSQANILTEVEYFDSPLSKTFERTYGWAWLLKLQQELITWNDPDGIKWRNALQPLCDTIVAAWMKFLPKQTYANRTGTHPNTAFGLTLAFDYAKTAKNKSFSDAITRSAMDLYFKDKNAPADWEPNGSDFFSPALEEADLMRRILNRKEFIQWFNSFLPDKAIAHLTKLPVVSDRSDYQIVHLDGLCFSRSWCMRGIALDLPVADKRRNLLLRSSLQHLNASLANVANGGYGGEHWLASFAVYAIGE